MHLQNTTLSKLLAIIHQQHHLDVSSVTLNTSLADVGLDSLAVAELLFSIEDEFKISLGAVESDAMPATVGELVTLITSHQK
jgi:acyl carrier protein